MLNLDTITHDIISDMSQRAKIQQILFDLYAAGLNAVKGQYAVEQQLRRTPINGDVAVVAIGKAASAMMMGAKNVLSEQIKSALIMTKVGHIHDLSGFPSIEAGHPIPDQHSLDAGAKFLKFISNIPEKTTFLALISGGTSALVEILPEKIDLLLLQKTNNWLLASGLTIHEMNRVRQRMSLIKAGKALNYLNVDTMVQFLISDVKGDDLTIIGSGLFVAPEHAEHKLDISESLSLPCWLQDSLLPEQPHIAQVEVESHIVANNDMACQEIVAFAKKIGYPAIYYGQTLYGDVLNLAESLVIELLKAKPGIHIWGGEPSIVLPVEPGRGGRNQSLALAIACHLENRTGITVLVGATDGSDGSTDDAGAIIDGFTLQRGAHCGMAKDYLLAADAGSFLAEAGDLLSTGPTGTNVMDIIIALKEPV